MSVTSSAMQPYKTIPLRRRDGSVRAYTLVDPEDYERLGHYRWHLEGRGYVCRSPSIAGGAPRTVRFLHREVVGLTVGDGKSVDHINGDPLDNRRANLRLCPRGQRDNLQNRSGVLGASGYRGVTWDASRAKWKAQATINGRTVNLGRFDDVRNAARAARDYRAARMPFATN